MKEFFEGLKILIEDIFDHLLVFIVVIGGLSALAVFFGCYPGCIFFSVVCHTCPIEGYVIAIIGGFIVYQYTKNW